MSDTIIVNFDLRAGIDPADFSRFVAEVDHAHNRKRRECLRFETYVSQSGAGDSTHVTEVIEVTARSEWEEAMAGEDQVPIAAQWESFAAPDSVVETWVTNAHDLVRRQA